MERTGGPGAAPAGPVPGVEVPLPQLQLINKLRTVLQNCRLTGTES